MIKLFQNDKLVAILNPDDFVSEVMTRSALNREYTIDFSIDKNNEKAKFITSDTKLCCEGVYYTLNCENSIEYEYENKDILRVRGEGLYKDLENVFIEPFLSNDPNTKVPADLTVMLVGGGDDLTNGKYKVGTAGNVLYAILNNANCGWSVGTVDVDGIFDLEVEKKSVLGLIQDVQNIWGGYIVWDFENKVIHLRDENKWAIDRGFTLNENKNVRIVKTQVDKVFNKVYPFGENYLDIAKVNNGVKSLGDGNSVRICENFNIKDQEELLKWGKEQLAYFSKPRFNYSCDIVDLRELEGYESEVFELGDMVRVKTRGSDLSEPMRIIAVERNMLKRFEVRLEVGEPKIRLEDVLKASLDTSDKMGKVLSPDGKINGNRLADSSVISDSIDKAAIDASKFNVRQIILTGDVVTDDTVNKSISWNTHKLFYDGKEYEMPAGRTNKKFVVWRYGASQYENLTELEFENKPLGDNDFVIYVNNDGVHDVAWYSRIARQFIGATFIADASINNAKIRDLSATKLTTGRVQSVNRDTWIDLDTGDFSFKNGAIKWDSDKQELVIGNLSSIDEKMSDFEKSIVQAKNDLSKQITDTDNRTRADLNTKIDNNVNTINQTIFDVNQRVDDNKRYFVDELGNIRQVNADNYAELSALIDNTNNDLTESVRTINNNINTAVNGAKQEMVNKLNDAIRTQDKSIEEVQKSISTVASNVLKQAQDNNRIWYVNSVSNLNSNGINGKSWASLTPSRPNNADHNGDIAVIGGMTTDFMQNMKVYYNAKWIPLSEGAFLIENKDYNGVKISTKGIQIYNSNGTMKSEFNKDFLRFYGSPTPRAETYTSPTPFSEVNNGGMQFISKFGTSQYLRDFYLIEIQGGKSSFDVILPDRFKNYNLRDMDAIIFPRIELQGAIPYSTTLRDGDSVDDMVKDQKIFFGVGNYAANLTTGGVTKDHLLKAPWEMWSWIIDFDTPRIDVPRNKLSYDFLKEKVVASCTLFQSTTYVSIVSDNGWSAFKVKGREETIYKGIEGVLMVTVQ